MKKVNYEKLQAGELVQVPRSQFAPMRRGWNGWLFSEAEKAFYAEYVFQTNAVAIAKKFLAEDNVTTKEEFYEFIERDDVTGCDWIKFLIDKGFLF